MVIKRDEETSEVRRSSHVLSREEKGKGTLVQARDGVSRGDQTD